MRTQSNSQKTHLLSMQQLNNSFCKKNALQINISRANSGIKKDDEEPETIVRSWQMCYFLNSKWYSIIYNITIVQYTVLSKHGYKVNSHLTPYCLGFFISLCGSFYSLWSLKISNSLVRKWNFLALVSWEGAFLQTCQLYSQYSMIYSILFHTVPSASASVENP